MEGGREFHCRLFRFYCTTSKRIKLIYIIVCAKILLIFKMEYIEYIVIYSDTRNIFVNFLHCVKLLADHFDDITLFDRFIMNWNALMTCTIHFFMSNTICITSFILILSHIQTNFITLLSVSGDCWKCDFRYFTFLNLAKIYYVTRIKKVSFKICMAAKKIFYTLSSIYLNGLKCIVTLFSFLKLFIHQDYYA